LCILTDSLVGTNDVSKVKWLILYNHDLLEPHVVFFVVVVNTDMLIACYVVNNILAEPLQLYESSPLIVDVVDDDDEYEWESHWVMR